MTKDSTKKYNDIPIIELLKKIQNQIVDPTNFPKETRKACVQVLLCEGYTQTAMASLLKTCDRTIRRDIVEIRKENSLEAGPELTAELLGDMVTIARASFARLKQIARSANSTPGAMTDAEFLAWTVMKEMVEKLDLVGFLKLGEGFPKPYNPAKDSTGAFNEEEKAFQRQCELMTPMQREMLVEKMYRWMNTIVEEKNKESSSNSQQSPPPESK